MAREDERVRTAAQPTKPKAQESTGLQEQLAGENMRLAQENERLLAELKRLREADDPQVHQVPVAAGEKKFWQIDLGKSGPITPSLYFRREFPGDPRGYAIEAATREEAWGIFCKMHGILNCSVAPTIGELSKEQADDLRKPLSTKTKGQAVNMPPPLLTQVV
jgi:hypothetical protein